jgi:MADS-box transcription factor
MAQFQGDRDSRGPADFSGAAGGKYDDEGDDHDDDDDDVDSNRRSIKRKASKFGMQSDMAAVSVVLSSADTLPNFRHPKARLPSPSPS